MKDLRRGLVVAAVAVAALPIYRPTWAMELTFEVAGRYNAVIETEITAALTLNADGSAQYVVRWLDGEGSEVLDKVSVDGRWIKEGNTLTLIVPHKGDAARVVYEVSPCLSYKSFGSPGCSPGLHVITSELPRGLTWELWKTELLKL